MAQAATVSIQELHPLVHAALRAWRELSSDQGNLLEELLLVQEQQNKEPDDSPAMKRLATNKILLSAISELEKSNRQSAQLLKMRFLDNDATLMVANKLDLSEDQVKRRQRDAIQQLSQTLLGQEKAVRQERIEEIENKLPPATYSATFGIDAMRTTLAHKLLTPSAPWIIALTGIGGIGKTTLADTTVRQIINQFHYTQIIWLHITPKFTEPETTAVNPMFDALMSELAQRLCPYLSPRSTRDERNLAVRRALKALPYLIVIDNLEAESETASLLTHLDDLANPSKFLLTTRIRPPGQIGIIQIPLPELSLPAATQLIQHHAQNIGLHELAEAAVGQIEAIISVTGGNPLAIKLVVGLAPVLPLNQVLSDLTKARSEEAERLYRHIYWQAWHTLSPQARTLLEIMPIAKGNIGISPEQMLAVSQLNKRDFWPAVTELVNRSLLDVRGTTWERRYSIHRLTESFLRTEIIHWPEEHL